LNARQGVRTEMPKASSERYKMGDGRYR